MTLSSTQIKMFRAAVGWSQDQLAQESGLSSPTIYGVETGKPVSGKTEEKIRAVMSVHGFDTTQAGGVEPKQDAIRTFNGTEEFLRFWDDVYMTLKAKPTEIVCCNVDEDLITEVKGDYSDFHLDRMDKLSAEKGVSFRCTIKKGDFALPAKYGEYRWSDAFGDASFYCYGDKLAIMTFQNKVPHVALHESKSLADSWRMQFDAIWQQAEVIA